MSVWATTCSGAGLLHAYWWVCGGGCGGSGGGEEQHHRLEVSIWANISQVKTASHQPEVMMMMMMILIVVL